MNNTPFTFSTTTSFGPKSTNCSENSQINNGKNVFNKNFNKNPFSPPIERNGIFRQPQLITIKSKSTSDNMLEPENVFNKSAFGSNKSPFGSSVDKGFPLSQVEKKNPFNPFNTTPSSPPFKSSFPMFPSFEEKKENDKNEERIIFSKNNYVDGRNGIFHNLKTRDEITVTKSENENDIHRNVFCDHCQQCPIVGVRYRCSMCANYDLCEKCLVLNENSSIPFHDESHVFYRLTKRTKTTIVKKKIVEHFPIILNRANKGVTCSGCQKKNPTGYLYKCQKCPHVHLCESCEAQGVHDINHPRTKIVGCITY